MVKIEYASKLDYVKDKLGMEVTIPWKNVYVKKEHPYSIFEISPTTSVRNNQAYVLAKVISGFYRTGRERRTWLANNVLLTVTEPYRVNFRIVLTEKDIAFYLLVPKDKSREIVRKAEGIYDNNITISRVPKIPKLDPENTFLTELHYRKHDIFSLDTDRSNNYPLPSLLTAVRTLEEGDVAIFDVLLEPKNPRAWAKEARDAHNLLEKGYVPDNTIGGKILRGLDQLFNMLRMEILELTRISPKQQDEFNRWKREQGQAAEARRIIADMSNATRRKQDAETLKAWLRIAVQSKKEERAKSAAYTIANAWKDISADNELVRYDVPDRIAGWYLNRIENRKPGSIRLKPITVSAEEAGKFMQLPGRELIEEFPEIRARKLKDVSIPDELTRKDIAGVRLCYVTVRGKKKLIKIPLEAYPGVKRKHVYDALCTASFGQGKQGTGKSEGYGTNWAYDFVTNGFTAVIIDTADGQVLRNFINSLPKDFPEEKIHALNLDNKAWPIALNWSDVYGRSFGNGQDEELQALEISERITKRFVDFINSLSKTGEFTDRMAQYVTSCMRAITVRRSWSFLDLELALTSPAYREELLQLEKVKENPDVVRDLETLQELAETGKERRITDPIINRLNVLSNSQFMTNLFYQEPKIRNGKPVLDFRRLLDNPEGGYGHVVAIQASGDAWGENQAIILGFMLDKINFNAFSRVDTDQENRKPALIWIDEPHKVIGTLEKRLAGTSVEFRKYRIKNLFTGHSIDQMGEAANALLDGGAQITSYKTERLSQLERFAHLFKPYDNAKELYSALPEKWTAVNSVRLPSGKPCPAFIGDMVPPPKEVKDRSYIWEKSARKYGRPWKEVRDQIRSKRNKYRKLDEEWRQDGDEEAQG